MNQGEAVAEWVLCRGGWKITGRQVTISSGHRLDFTAVHPDTGEEWLIEVKTWEQEKSGRDTVKKALADAYDLAELGELRPFMLVLSHELLGLYGDMITRARRAGAINDVRVIEATEHYGETP